MNEQFNILLATARSYLALAKSLKKQGISYRHYLISAQNCLKMANDIGLLIKELDSLVEIRDKEVTEIMKAA